MTLKELREKIDQVDKQILKLLNRRVSFVKKIGALKSKRNVQFHDPERERLILRRLQRENKGPLPNKAVTSIYRSW